MKKQSAQAPGYTKTHVDVMEAVARGAGSVEAVAQEVMISPRLAQALLDDLCDGGYLGKR